MGAVETDASLARFREAVARGEDLDLGEAALLLELFARPRLDVAAYLARLDQLAALARPAAGDPIETLRRLFGGDGFHGNDQAYYDPRNSFLSEVLDRRLGIPISLAVVAIEVGRRLGIEIEGVPFPGHFLVRVKQGAATVLLDLFAGVSALEDADLLLRLRAVTGRIGSLGPESLGRASKSQILVRMLHNLKAIYFRADDIARAIAVEERLIVLLPGDPRERRDRGLLLARIGRDLEAEAELIGYLEAMPAASDREDILELVAQLARRRGPLN